MRFCWSLGEVIWTAAMTTNATVLERAFELASSGMCASLDDLRRRLKKEGYELNQLQGRALRMQLLGLIKKAGQERK
jgi:hypothetical protein